MRTQCSRKEDQQEVFKLRTRFSNIAAVEGNNIILAQIVLSSNTTIKVVFPHLHLKPILFNHGHNL
jgi:hypothetical protein